MRRAGKGTSPRPEEILPEEIPPEEILIGKLRQIWKKGTPVHRQCVSFYVDYLYGRISPAAAPRWTRSHRLTYRTMILMDELDALPVSEAGDLLNGLDATLSLIEAGIERRKKKQ